MEIKSYIINNKAVVVLTVLLLASIIFNVLSLNAPTQEQQSTNYSHLAPEVAWLGVSDFVAAQGKYSVEFQGLKRGIQSILNDSNLKGRYGVYFEDLATGAWIGINERNEFVSASLLKVPVMIAILKKVEKGELNLNTEVVINQENLNSASGTLYMRGAGYTLTIRELLVYLIKESDNTALLTLEQEFLTSENIIEARVATGLPVDGDHIVALGPKHYSNMLRSLYYSSYLRQAFSETALSIMSETDYNDHIPAGVPTDIPISHKVGFTYEGEKLVTYHDCGIIYHPKKPYILCIMSKGATEKEATNVMQSVSKIAYEYVDKISNK